jgi:hypothetical protein
MLNSPKKQCEPSQEAKDLKKKKKKETQRANTTGRKV